MVHFDKWLLDESGRRFMRNFRLDETKIYFPRSFYRTWEKIIDTHVLLVDPIRIRFTVCVSTDKSGFFLGNGLNTVRDVHKNHVFLIIYMVQDCEKKLFPNKLIQC